jgi:hypothetical protein
MARVLEREKRARPAATKAMGPGHTTTRQQTSYNMARILGACFHPITGVYPNRADGLVAAKSGAKGLLRSAKNALKAA